MSLIDRLHERRQRLADNRNQPKGSLLFWYCVISLAIGLLRLLRQK